MEEQVLPRKDWTESDNGRRSEGNANIESTQKSLLTEEQRERLAKHDIHVDLVHYAGDGYDFKVLKFDSSLYFVNGIKALEDADVYSIFKSAQTKASFTSWEDDWQAYLKKWEESAESRPPFMAEEPEPVIFDDLFAEVLSKEGLIEINDWLIRVDLEKNLTKVIKADDLESIPELLSDGCGSDSDRVMCFDSDTEAWPYLEEGANYTPSNGRVECSDPRASGDKDETRGPRQGDKRSHTKVTYQKATIYFSIIAKIKGQKKGAFGAWYNKEIGYIGMNLRGSYGIRCGSGFNTYNAAIESAGRKATLRAYQSSNGLSGYSFICDHYWAEYSSPSQRMFGRTLRISG
ncbi:MAG: hypothetical protein AAF740_02805 [Bacteroidota bacterium]